MSARLRLPFVVTDADGSDRDLVLIGQYARTLRALIDSGAKGMTALDVSNTWAMRLGHYVWVLRHRDGLSITTTWEAHDGAAGPGRHGRYTLNSPARIVAISEARAAMSQTILATIGLLDDEKAGS
jgi:hypothetical protein